MKEEWKPIPGYEEAYFVSNLGRIKSIARSVPHGRSGSIRIKERILKDSKAGDGYRQVHLYMHGIRENRNRYVHELVLSAFVCPRPKWAVHTRHHDGIRHHNLLSNISWATAEENKQDELLHGTRNNGERNGGVKITANDAMYIKQSSESCYLLAKQFGVSNQHISRIKTGKKWAHI